MDAEGEEVGLTSSRSFLADIDCFVNDGIEHHPQHRHVTFSLHPGIEPRFDSRRKHQGHGCSCDAIAVSHRVDSAIELEEPVRAWLRLNGLSGIGAEDLFQQSGNRELRQAANFVLRVLRLERDVGRVVSAGVGPLQAVALRQLLKVVRVSHCFFRSTCAEM
jgi:hypothetical protein